MQNSFLISPSASWFIYQIFLSTISCHAKVKDNTVAMQSDQHATSPHSFKTIKIKKIKNNKIVCKCYNFTQMWKRILISSLLQLSEIFF